MSSAYIEARDGNLYVGPSRVTVEKFTVESVIARWQSGRTPEDIHAGFPSVPLVAVYGTTTYYLEHKDELDAFFRETEELDDARRAADEAARPEFYAGMHQRLDAARKRLDLESPVS